MRAKQFFLLWLSISSSATQQTGPPTQSDLGSLLEYQKAIEASAKKLRAEVAALQNQLISDPAKQQREEMENLQRLRLDLRDALEKAGQLAPACIDGSLPGALNDCLAEKIRSGGEELKRREDAMAADRDQLRRLLQAKQHELAIKDALAAEIEFRIRESREERDRSNKYAELQALQDALKKAESPPARARPPAAPREGNIQENPNP